MRAGRIGRLGRLKMTAARGAALAALSAALLAPAAAQAGWVNAANGSIPGGTEQAGHEANGQALFLCRASFQNGVHPGKIRYGFSGCNIGYGGKEYTVNTYQVWVGHIPWFGQFSSGQLPPNLAPAGREANGQPLGACRAEFNGGDHPGKIRPGFSGCNIGYGGREYTAPNYDVMVR